MSNAHSDAICPLELPAPTKFVLFRLADHACEICGLTWVGVPVLAIETRLGRTRIKEALRELENGGWLKIHAYPTGGRGRATEYVVLPGVLELSTAPCGKCVDNFKRGRRATRNVGQEGQASVKGVGMDPQYGSRGDPQPPIEPNPQRTRTRARGPAESSTPMKPGSPTNSTFQPPTTPPESRSAAKDRATATRTLVHDLGETLRLKPRPTGIPGKNPS